MDTETVKKNYITLIVLCAAMASFGANLANPAAQVGDARMSFGASYFIGGADITDLEIPMMMNRVDMRISYSPIRYVNFGADFGTVQLSVDKYSVNGRDTVPIFEGKFGWSAGGHLKLSTPYIFDYVSILALGNANVFRSTNKQKAYYGGTDITAAAGLQIRVPNGRISLGPQIYMILGDNKGVYKIKDEYSNVNNMRAWIAFDYLPEDLLGGDHQPYLSIEFTASPKINGSKRAPIREFSVSVSVGSITQRLYGKDTGSDYDW